MLMKSGDGQVEPQEKKKTPKGRAKKRYVLLWQTRTAWIWYRKKTDLRWDKNYIH